MLLGIAFCGGLAQQYGIAAIGFVSFVSLVAVLTVVSLLLMVERRDRASILLFVLSIFQGGLGVLLFLLLEVLDA